MNVNCKKLYTKLKIMMDINLYHIGQSRVENIKIENWYGGVLDLEPVCRYNKGTIT